MRFATGMSIKLSRRRLSLEIDIAAPLDESRLLRRLRVISGNIRRNGYFFAFIKRTEILHCMIAELELVVVIFRMKLVFFI